VPGDSTRFRFDPRRRFSAVLRREGRVQLDSDANELYTLLRRLLVFIETSLRAALQWAGFEPKDPPPRRRRRR